MYQVLALPEQYSSLEKWLNDQYAKGWKLLAIYGDLFIFENVRPAVRC